MAKKSVNSWEIPFPEIPADTTISGWHANVSGFHWDCAAASSNHLLLKITVPLLSFPILALLGIQKPTMRPTISNMIHCASRGIRQNENGRESILINLSKRAHIWQFQSKINQYGTFSVAWIRNFRREPKRKRHSHNFKCWSKFLSYLLPQG